MRMMVASALAASCAIASLFPGRPALADEFTCSSLVLTRLLPGAITSGEHVFSVETRLLLSIDKARPGRSTLRWTGEPRMDGLTSSWPDNTQVIVENGIIAASFAASRSGLSSVGSLTLDASGRLRTTESTLTPKGIIYDVLEGVCSKGG